MADLSPESVVVPVAETEPPMDIHKPKPVHNWREFSSEIAVIVVGVMIALGGEQIVENFRERIAAREAQDQVNAELATDFAVLGNRRRAEPCIARRIDEVAKLLAVADTPAYVAPGWVGRPSVWDNQTARFQAASQSGRIALLGQQAQFTYSFVYSQIAALQAAQSDESEQWSRLQALQGVAHPSPGLLDSARVALAKVRHDDDAIRTRLSESSNALKELGIAPVPSPVTDTDPDICWPITLPTDEGYRRIDTIMSTYK